jgi:hypothetical protein
VVNVENVINPDGTYNTRKTVTTEQPVGEAEVVYEENIFTQTERVTKRNQRASGAKPKHTKGSVKTVVNRKTPGGRHDVTIETVTSSPVGDAAVSEQQTISEIRTTKLARNQDGRPDVASDAGGGTRMESRATENADGTFDVETTTIVEQPVAGAVTSKVVDKFHTVERTESLNQAAPVADADQVDGEVKRVTNAMTPGGYVNTTEEVTRAHTVEKAEEVKQLTLYRQITSQRDRNVLAPTGDAQAGNGELVEKRFTMNPDGTHDVVTETTVERPVAAAEVTETETEFASHVRTVSRAQDNKSTKKRAKGTTLRKGYTRTDGGLYDVVEEETTPKAVDEANVTTDNNAYRFMRTTMDRNASGAQEVGETEPGARRVECSMNEDGTYDVSETEVVEKQIDYESERTIDHLETRERTVRRGLPFAPPNPNELSPGKVTRQVVSLSETGKYQEDLSTTTAHPKSFAVKLAKDPSGTIRQVISFRNYTAAQAQAALAACHSGSAAPNAFGLYDGSGTIITYQEGGRKVSARRDIKEFDETSTTGDIRIVSANGKIYKVTEQITYKVGIVHDSSGDRPYREVNKCLRPDVKNLGDGYWQYYGITKKTITWDPVDGGDTITHSWEA